MSAETIEIAALGITLQGPERQLDDLLSKVRRLTDGKYEVKLGLDTQEIQKAATATQNVTRAQNEQVQSARAQRTEAQAQTAELRRQAAEQNVLTAALRRQGAEARVTAQLAAQTTREREREARALKAASDIAIRALDNEQRATRNLRQANQLTNQEVVQLQTNIQRRALEAAASLDRESDAYRRLTQVAAAAQRTIDAAEGRNTFGGFSFGIQQGLLSALGNLGPFGQALEALLKTQLDQAAQTTQREAQDIGTNISDGLQGGLRSGAAETANAARQTAEGVTQTIKKTLDIRSPSRVMFNLGVFTAQGLVDGLKSKQDDVARAAKSLSDTIERNAVPGAGARTTASAVSGGALGGNVFAASAFANLSQSVGQVTQQLGQDLPKAAQQAAEATNAAGEAAAGAGVDLGGATEGVKSLTLAHKENDPAARQTAINEAKTAIAFAVTGAAVVGLGAAMAASVNTAADFEQAMNKAGATTNATGAQLKSLTSLALDDTFIQLGVGGIEAAAGIEELGSQGLETADILNGGLVNATLLAKATSSDMAVAAAVAASSMKAFNLEASDLGEVADVVTNAVNATSIKMQDFSQSIAAAGAVATTSGIDFTTFTAAISLMTDKAISASDAGTSFKTFLQSLTPNSKAASQAMNDLTFSAFTANGEFKPLAQIVEELRVKFSKLTPEQRAFTAETIFGSDGIRAFNILIEQGQKGLAERVQLLDQNGSAQRAAEDQLKGLRGEQEKFNAALENLKTTAGSNLLPALTPVLDWATSFTSELGQALRSLRELNDFKIKDGDGSILATLKFFSGAFKGLNDFAKFLDEKGQFDNLAGGRAGAAFPAFQLSPIAQAIQARNRQAASVDFPSLAANGGSNSSVLGLPPLLGAQQAQNAAGGFSAEFVASLKDVFVNDPKVSSDCAIIASRILNLIGATIESTPVAGQLVTNAKKAGFQQVSDGATGDLVALRGPQYGAIKDKLGNGTHVAVVVGRDDKGRLLIIENPGSGNTQVVPLYDTKNASFYRAPSSPFAKSTGGTTDTAVSAPAFSGITDAQILKAKELTVALEAAQKARDPKAIDRASQALETFRKASDSNARALAALAQIQKEQTTSAKDYIATQADIQRYSREALAIARQEIQAGQSGDVAFKGRVKARVEGFEAEGKAQKAVLELARDAVREQTRLNKEQGPAEQAILAHRQEALRVARLIQQAEKDRSKVAPADAAKRALEETDAGKIALSRARDELQAQDRLTQERKKRQDDAKRDAENAAKQLVNLTQQQLQQEVQRREDAARQLETLRTRELAAAGEDAQKRLAVENQLAGRIQSAQAQAAQARLTLAKRNAEEERQTALSAIPDGIPQAKRAQLERSIEAAFNGKLSGAYRTFYASMSSAATTAADNIASAANKIVVTQLDAAQKITSARFALSPELLRFSFGGGEDGLQGALSAYGASSLEQLKAYAPQVAQIIEQAYADVIETARETAEELGKLQDAAPLSDARRFTLTPALLRFSFGEDGLNAALRAYGFRDVADLQSSTTQVAALLREAYADVLFFITTANQTAAQASADYIDLLLKGIREEQDIQDVQLTFDDLWKMLRRVYANGLDPQQSGFVQLLDQLISKGNQAAGEVKQLVEAASRLEDTKPSSAFSFLGPSTPEGSGPRVESEREAFNRIGRETRALPSTFELARGDDGSEAAFQKQLDQLREWNKLMDRLNLDRRRAELQGYTDEQLDAALTLAITNKNARQYLDILAEQERRLQSTTQSTYDHNAALKQQWEFLEGLVNEYAQLASAFGNLAGAVGANDLQANINGVVNLFKSGFSIAKDLASGNLIGAAVTLISTLADAFTGYSRAYAEAAKKQQDFENSLTGTFIKAADFGKTSVRSRGFFADLFGGGPEVTQEIDKVGLEFAKSISGGFESGLRNGLKQAILQNDFSLFTTSLKESVGDAILNAIIESFLQGELLKNIIAPAIKNFVDALKTDDLADDNAALDGLFNAVDQATALGEKFYAGIAPVRQRLVDGGYLKPPEPSGLTNSSTKDLFGRTPDLGFASVSTPFLIGLEQIGNAAPIYLQAAQTQLQAAQLFQDVVRVFGQQGMRVVIDGGSSSSTAAFR
ncbi:phage tail tape measure protein [Deinococcus peraridilitoris]|uniref:Phage tail tape measure protein, TP901 family n=1 Tax=Deinococcus peraridilitoris (strain DSM 19664 / LMG 22246 / CIP 109416 / KR-200) TaxID=937777 RepID=L0A105_DEIPD|nr:phage tail tape measure protein [Deinococcus peraridilitoris]AFZ67578.1 phage tail tape measure protein, TP901 family [Deinococcus peraridilitoris DSM 19664]